MKKIIFLASVVSMAALADPSPATPPAPSKAMGQAIFEQNGANSCMYCHGITGEGGKVAAAAKLTHPKSWKTYKGLKQGADFPAHMQEALVNLIQKGAIAHNSGFKPAWFDWKATGGPINGQMLGLSGAPSAAWLSRFKDKGVTREIAAQSVYLYIQSFDTEGVFKK